MSKLREQISGFRIHEETPVDLIINSHSIGEVFAELESILQSSDSETIAGTLAFIRDANLYKHLHRDAFQEHLRTSSLWKAFQKLLTAPNYWVRKGTIYTIAKLCERNRAHLLTEAFPFYLEKDPVNLPNLIKELVWLTNKWNWNCIEQTAKAKKFMQRWSLCQLLDDDGSPVEIKQRYLEVLSPLKSDPEPLVAAEATLRFERIKIKTGPKLQKPEWRSEIQRISGLEPRITFESTAMQFMSERNDYTLDEFEQFIGRLT